MKDLMNLVNPRVAIARRSRRTPAARSSARSSTATDFESLTFLIALGLLTDTDVTFTVAIDARRRSGAGRRRAVAATDIIGTLALAGGNVRSDDNVCKKIGYIGSKRYTRITVTTAANDAGSFPVAVTALLGHPKQVPTVNPPV
jgi:hypothetical protein